jgi:hypothetical protein
MNIFKTIKILVIMDKIYYFYDLLLELKMNDKKVLFTELSIFLNRVIEENIKNKVLVQIFSGGKLR